MLEYVSEFPSFVRLNNISLYMYILHLFICSCVDRPLGYFCLLTIVNTFAVKMLFESLLSLLRDMYPNLYI